MSVNDKEIEVLLRRYAQSASGRLAHSDHLDADELNAFAENAMPPATRQRYVSHLADCDDCRKAVGELVVAAGSAVEARVPASEPIADSWWRKLRELFSPPAVRYAAFAVLAVAMVGISFLVWRRPAQRSAESVALNQPHTSAANTTTSEPALGSQKEITVKPEGLIAKAAPQPTVMPGSEQATTGTAAARPPPPKPESESDKPALAARATEPARSEASPSYAPPPPAETSRTEDRAREQRNAGELAPSGPRRGDYDKYKTMDRARSGEFAKERDEEQKRVANQPAANETKDDASARARTSSGLADVRGRSVQEARVETKKAEAAEEANEKRAVGGRKFKRQGDAWVDTKFKSSMSVRNVSRGSEEFKQLDSGLRSIAQQLTGEIVVVWKGKAYRIK